MQVKINITTKGTVGLYTISTTISEHYINIGINYKLKFPQYCYGKFKIYEFNNYLSEICLLISQKTGVSNVSIMNKEVVFGEYNVITNASVIISYTQNS